MGDYGLLNDEMRKYEESMKSFLPFEEIYNKARRKGISTDEIVKLLGENTWILSYVPNTLYHGSIKNVDILNPNESTQQGSYVYATDNPIHALFFSIFKNSSEVRSHIKEYIDKNGEYKVKYEIDERISGALNKALDSQDVNIYVCDGSQFFKPQGEAYIGREWISKDGQSIKPINKITVNARQFLYSLEQQGLVEYSKYDKSKDWQTVIDMLSKNYAYMFNTNRFKNTEELDTMFDSFIGENFPEQLAFSKKFRTHIKNIMVTNYRLNDPTMTLENETDYKLKSIKELGDSFLIAEKDENGKIAWNVDVKKVDAFMKITDETKEEIKTDELEKSKVLIKNDRKLLNGFTDALLLSLLTGFVGGVITTIIIGIIVK